MLGLIVGALSSIATAALSVVKTLASTGLVGQALKMVGNVIATMAKGLGLVQPEQEVDELGDRALQAEEKGITPEKCESYEEWIKTIEQNDWGYDPEKNKDMDMDTKVMKGVEVSSAVTIEKFPDVPIEDFLKLAGNNHEFFTPEKMKAIATLAATDRNGFAKVVDYVIGAAKDHISVNTASDILINIEKEENPGMSDNIAYDKVTKYQDLK